MSTKLGQSHRRCVRRRTRKPQYLLPARVDYDRRWQRLHDVLQGSEVDHTDCPGELVRQGAVMIQAIERHPTIESLPPTKAISAKPKPRRENSWPVTCRPPSSRVHPAKKGFAPTAFRWRIKRTLAWFGQCRPLSKEYEKTVATPEARLRCVMMRLLVRRLSC